MAADAAAASAAAPLPADCADFDAVQRRCDEGARRAAWGAMNWLPFVGPALVQTSWGKKLNWPATQDWVPTDAAQAAATMDAEVARATDAWRDAVSVAFKDLAHEFRSYADDVVQDYRAQIEAAAETSSEATTLVAINLAFLAAIVAFMVFRYA